MVQPGQDWDGDNADLANIASTSSICSELTSSERNTELPKGATAPT